MKPEQAFTGAIGDWLPHKDPMILIDHVRSISPSAIDCMSKPGTIGFYRCDRGIPIAWGIEIIAQACALFISFRAKGSGMTKGRLLKCRTFDFHQSHIPYGISFAVLARPIVQGSSGISIFEGSISGPDGIPYLTGELTLQAST